MTLQIATIREWLVDNGTMILCTAGENMVMNYLTKDHRESRAYPARGCDNRSMSTVDGFSSSFGDCGVLHQKPLG